METHISSYRVEEEARRSHDTHMINDDSLQILEGLIKEVDDIGHQMFDKMISKDVPIERVVRETLHDHFHGKHGSHHMLEKIAKKLNKVGEEYGDHGGERGVDGDVLQENKLERFKVKNVNAIGAGIIKEEEQ